MILQDEDPEGSNAALDRSLLEKELDEFCYQNFDCNLSALTDDNAMVSGKNVKMLIKGVTNFWLKR